MDVETTDGDGELKVEDDSQNLNLMDVSIKDEPLESDPSEENAEALDNSEKIQEGAHGNHLPETEITSDTSVKDLKMKTELVENSDLLEEDVPPSDTLKNHSSDGTADYGESIKIKSEAAGENDLERNIIMENLEENFVQMLMEKHFLEDETETDEPALSTRSAEEEDTMVNLDDLRYKLFCKESVLKRAAKLISNKRSYLHYMKQLASSSAGSSGIAIATTRNTKDKRCWDKLFACYYCEKLFTNIRIHLFNKHSTETEVKQIHSYSLHSPERSKLLCLLRNLGNFQHNVRVLQDNEGILIVNRRPNKADRLNYADYIPCRFCFGFFYKQDLNKHARACMFNKNEAANHALLEGTVLLYEATSGPPTHDSDIHLMIRNMRQDNLFHFLSKDYLILRYVHFLIDGKVEEENIKERIRNLGILLILLREQRTAHDVTLNEYLVSNSVQAILSSVIRMTNSVKCKKATRFVRTLGHSIRCCSNIKIGLAIKKNDIMSKKDAENFLALFNKEWKQKFASYVADEISKETDELSPNEERVQTPESTPLSPDDINAMEVALAEELIKLSSYLTRHIDEKRKSLENNINQDNWLELAQAVLCRIVVFNKKRGEETTRMLVSSYTCEANWSKNTEDEAYSCLTAVEKLICKRLGLLRIEGRNGKYVPVILPPETKDSLELLMRTRDASEIPIQNLYVFSNATNCGHFRSWNIITKYGKQCNLERLHLLTNTNLRKFISTYTQLLLLDDSEVAEIIKILNLGMDFQNNFANIFQSPRKLAKLCSAIIDLESCSRQGPLDSQTLQSMEDKALLDDVPNQHITDDNANEYQNCESSVKQNCSQENFEEQIFTPLIKKEAPDYIDSEDDDYSLNLAPKRRKSIKPEAPQEELSTASDVQSSHSSVVKKLLRECDSSSSMITIAVSRNTKDKRCHDKVFACFYCSKLFSNMRVHYLRRHPKEAEVEEIQQFSIGSPERSNLLCQLRNLGNFKHNVRVLRNNEGMFIVNRRPNKNSSRQNYLNYIPCRHCYGFFFKYDLKRHANICVFNVSEFTKHILSEGTILLYENTSALSAENFLDMLSDMDKNEMFSLLSQDYLLIRFGNFLANSVNTSNSEVLVKTKYLAQMLMLLHDQNSTPNASLSDFLVANSFDKVLSSTIQMVNSFETKKASLVISTIGHCIRACCSIKIGLAIKDSDKRRRRETEEFLNLFNSEWKPLLNASLAVSANTAASSVELLPTSNGDFRESEFFANSIEILLARELRKFSKYLTKCVNERRKALETNYSREGWLELSRAVLCRVVVFNKMRGGEDIARILVSSYNCKSNWSLNPEDDLYKELTAVERLILNRFDVFKCIGRNGKYFPIILPTESKLALDLLSIAREACGIPCQNIFLFSNGSKCGRYKSWIVLNKYLKNFKIKKFHLVTNSNFRNFVATCTQLLSVNLSEMETLEKGLFQTEDVQNQFSSSSKSPLEVAKLAKFLINHESNFQDKLAKFPSLQIAQNSENIQKSADSYVEEEVDAAGAIEETYFIPSVHMDCESNAESEVSEEIESMERVHQPSQENPKLGVVGSKRKSFSGSDEDVESPLRKPSKRRKVRGKARSGRGRGKGSSSSARESLPRCKKLGPTKRQSSATRYVSSPGKITVSLSRNTKDKIFYDKVFACFYCSQITSNVRVHYFRKHAREKEVRKIQKHPVRSSERSNLLCRLRNLGNFKHNVRVLRDNEGMLLVSRRPNVKSDHQNYKDYIPCRHCYGFFFKNDLRTHGKTCNFNSSGISKHTLSEGIILLYEATYDMPSENIFKILSSLKGDEIFDVLSNDYLIIRLGNFLADNEKMPDSEISQKMKDLTVLLIELRESSDRDSSLSDFIVAENFDQIISAVQKISLKVDCRDPNSFTVEIGHSIRSCCNIKIGNAIKENDLKMQNDTDDFLTLFNSEWKQRVSSFVLGEQVEAWSSDLSSLRGAGLHTKESAVTDEIISAVEVPLTEDIATLNEYIISYIKERKEALQNDTCLTNWLELAQAVLCRIVVLNKKKGDETTRVIVSTYTCKSNWSLDTGDALYSSLTLLEKMICSRFEVLRIKGKRGKYIPIIFPPEAKSSVDLLIEKRNACGIPQENNFVFSNATNNGHYRSWNIINKYGKQCGLKMLNLLTNSRLRKFIAVRAQLLALNRDDLEGLITSLSNANDSDESSYEVVKICRFLISGESSFPQSTNPFHPEDLTSEIAQNAQMTQPDELEWLGSLEDYDYIPPISEEYNKDYIELDSVQRSKLSRLPPDLLQDRVNRHERDPSRSPLNRFIWPSDLKKTLLEDFEGHITGQKCPGKQECEEWLSKVKVSNIPWKKVKDCVKNAYYVRK